MDRGEFDVFGILRFSLEPIDVVGLLERVERQIAEVLLQHRDTAAERLLAFQPCWLRAPLDVGVEEAGDVFRYGVGRLPRRSRPTWIASRLDFADEHAFPIACFL